MTWAPPDSPSDLVLRQVITRAREEALNGFTAERKRIESEQAAKGVLGGMVLARCGTAAETAIRTFGANVVSDLISVLEDVCGGPPPADALEWMRATVESQIDTLVTGVGAQIDGLRTGAGVKGAAKRIEPAGTAAKRDVEIAISRAGLRARKTRPAAAVPPVARVGAGAMYSLLVSSDRAAWSGTPFRLEKKRFLESTDSEVKKTLDNLDAAAVDRLVRLPCVFAYEQVCGKDPLFGVVRRVVPSDRDIRIEYEIVPVTPFLTQAQFMGLGAELAIEHSEFHHMHWAVKEVDLGRVMAKADVILPPADTWRPPVNVSTHHFDVGLSFPGEVRPFVRDVAQQLEGLLGSDRYFYDNNYESQLARPDLDLLLQDIYGNRSRLVVVFLSEAYETKPWCGGVEFRAIRQILMDRDQQRIMFVRMDDGAVKGTFRLDGAVDARHRTANEIARMIKQRVDVLH
jgi:hypothetical protein